MRKSLLITSDFPPTGGGISNYYYNLFKHLLPDKVVVIAPYVENCSKFDSMQSFKIFRFKIFLGKSTLKRVLKTFQFIFYILKILKIIKKEKIEVIHCGQYLSVGTIGIIFYKLFGIPYIVYAHGGELRAIRKYKIFRKIILYILNNANKIIVNSNFTKNEYINLGAKEEKFYIITPAVDVEKFKPDKKSEKIIKRYNLEGKKVLLTVCRLVERKGIDITLLALKDVIEKIADITYLIVGKGPAKSKLEKKVTDLHLDKKVIFCGFVEDDELLEYYNTCDIFVMPSREDEKDFEPVEGFGIVYLEANACRKPVIGGRSGGVPEAVIDGVTGLLVDPLSKEEIKNAILKLLQDEEYAKQLGWQGRKRVEDNFNWKRKAKELEIILSKDLEKN